MAFETWDQVSRPLCIIFGLGATNALATPSILHLTRILPLSASHASPLLLFCMQLEDPEPPRPACAVTTNLSMYLLSVPGSSSSGCTVCSCLKGMYAAHRCAFRNWPGDHTARRAAARDIGRCTRFQLLKNISSGSGEFKSSYTAERDVLLGHGEGHAGKVQTLWAQLSRS